MFLSPIALFTYNRPDHLIQTLLALKANRLARESKLHIFSDAPKTPKDVQRVAEVRKIIKNVVGFAEVTVRERTMNIGLARSIIEGVTELAAAYGSVIVLEDDLVVAPEFLTFMNQSLRRYEWDSRVMAVSGYMFPVETPNGIGSTFFCRVPTSWGWGTWDRAWKCLELDSAKLLVGLEDKSRREAFNVNGAYPYFEHLGFQAEGKLDVWGVRWYASMFAMGGLCLYPSRSLVQNIGMDGSGVHCGSSDNFHVTLSTSEAWDFPEVIAESPLALEAIRLFLLGLHGQKQASKIVDLASRLREVAGRMKRTVASVFKQPG